LAITKRAGVQAPHEQLVRGLHAHDCTHASAIRRAPGPHAMAGPAPPAGWRAPGACRALLTLWACGCRSAAAPHPSPLSPFPATTQHSRGWAAGRRAHLQPLGP
jgi:hypothetical protein